jgi:hypothetical protein
MEIKARRQSQSKAKPAASRRGAGVGARKQTTRAAATRITSTPRADQPAAADELHRTMADLIRRGQMQMRNVIDQLATILTPTAQPVVDDGFVLQARRNAELRQRLLHDYPVITSAQVAEMAHSTAQNRAALAASWRKDGRIFGVPRPSAEYVFPTLQFSDDGQPLPGMRAVIAAFPEDAREWQLFAWLATPNAWLEGRLPLSLLRTDPSSVARAAAEEFTASRW